MKQITVFLMCILFIGSLNAQINITNEIDWQKLDESIKSVKLLEPVNYGEFHTFRIKNINKFLYQVTIKGNNIELETPIPTELQTLFRLSKQDLEATTKQDEVIQTIESTSHDAQELANKSTTEVNDEIKKQMNSFYISMSSFLESITALSEDVYKLKVIRVELINLAMRDISSVDMKSIVENQKYSPTDPACAQTKMTQKFNQLKAEYDKISVNTDIKNAFSSAKKAYETIDKESILLLYTDVLFLNTELKNENNFIVISPPVQAQEDYITYEISVTPTRTNSLGAYKNPITTRFDVPIIGGFKVDFSVGPVFSFGKNSKDEKYYLEDSKNDGNSILKEQENKNFARPGLGALMHFYNRSGTNISWGGLFGVGAGFQSMTDVDLCFYSGLSLIMGKSQKVMISSGVSLFGVNRLKTNQYKVDGEYKTDEIDISNVVEKVYKPSLFLSLSYNVTNRKQK